MKINRGFTLIELIVVIVVIAILVSYAIPRLNLNTFRESGFVQQSTASLRYGQKQAIGSGCRINVFITATDCTIQFGLPVGVGCPAGGTNVVNPATGLNDFCESSTPESSADLPTTIQFDNIGRPNATLGDLSLNLGSRTITIEPETGFSHE
tara:strand:- start:1842 stop:2297 length:456 start_codon:yes stop_codon:yes gene_type:complete